MNAQELARELNAPGAQELLQSAALARLAYSGRDGFPTVIPIGFYWNGACHRVHGADLPEGGRPAGPAAGRADDRYRHFAGQGPANPRRGGDRNLGGVPDEYIEASAKTMDRAQLQDFEAHVRSVYKQMSRIAITPHWARFYDFGTGRVPAFLLKTREQLLAVQPNHRCDTPQPPSGTALPAGAP